MTGRIPNEPAASNTPSPDTVVVLAISRRVVMMSLGVAVLFGLSVVAGALFFRQLDDSPASNPRAPGADGLPPPVTFIPPTPEQQASAGRFSVSADDDPAQGPEDAPVVIIEFSDYQCQFCGQFARETLHPLLELYKDQVRFVYRDFVIYGPVSFQAALSAECANDQGAFWPYHDRLFEQQNNLSPRFFFAMAEELGLDMQQFARCVSDPAVEDEVKGDTAAGEALGIRGTPTFYINGRILVGAQPLDAFAAIIDEELARAASEPSSDSLQDAADDP